jgi:hypothetical protein
VLPKPPRELVVLLDESPLVVDVALDPLVPPLLNPELELVLVDWPGAQAGDPATAGPQFATGPR